MGGGVRHEAKAGGGGLSGKGGRGGFGACGINDDDN